MVKFNTFSVNDIVSELTSTVFREFAILLFGKKEQVKTEPGVRNDIPTPPGVDYVKKLCVISACWPCRSWFIELDKLFVSGIPVHSHKKSHFENLEFQSSHDVIELFTKWSECHDVVNMFVKKHLKET